MQQTGLEIEEINGESVLKSWKGYGYSLEIPEGVEVIGESAMEERALQKITLPSTLRRIEMRAFQKCVRLQELELPAGMERVEVEAFNGCTGLRRVGFRPGLRSIHARAFWNCPSLTEVDLPESVELIGSRAFESCSSLQKVTIRNPDVQVDEYAFNETPYCERLLRLAESCTVGRLGASAANCPEALVLPEGMTHIEHWGFSKSLIQSARLPSSLRTIGMCAFKGCTRLKEVSMSPNSYCNYRLRLEPGDGIFAGCTALEQVTFRGGLRSFTWYDQQQPELLRGCDREKTFMGCSRLRRILAWELPLEAIPPQWRQYAINGFLEDINRTEHYRPDIAAEYHLHLQGCKAQLIARTERDHSYPLHQYLTERRLLDREAFDAVFHRAQGKAEPQTMAVLLHYQHTVLGQENVLDAALAELDDL